MQSNEEITIQKQPALDCSLYDDDYDILASFPFHVNIIPLKQYSSVAFAYGEIENQINGIVIRNEKVLPRTFFCLKHLKSFDIMNSSIIPFPSDNDTDYQFPSEIENFAASLFSANIADKKITQLPEEFGKLKHLLNFYMRNTGLINLPDSIGNLTQLEFLRLDQNNLVSLPKTIANLELLNMIVLDNNPYLRSLQSLNGIRNLRHILATKCLIDRLPYDVPNLESLSMPNNSLRDLYGIETLGYNTNASKHFYFQSNRIRSIPPEIRFVRNLADLVLSDNQLTFLPREIFQIDTLEMLDISNNLFTTKELNTIIKTFNQTHPKLRLYY